MHLGSRTPIRGDRTPLRGDRTPVRSGDRTPSRGGDRTPSHDGSRTPSHDNIRTDDYDRVGTPSYPQLSPYSPYASGTPGDSVKIIFCSFSIFNSNIFKRVTQDLVLTLLHFHLLPEAWNLLIVCYFHFIFTMKFRCKLTSKKSYYSSIIPCHTFYFFNESTNSWNSKCRFSLY